jgi:hypothetical protein
MRDRSVEHFALLFDTAFPEWQVGPRGDQTRRCLVLQVPAPSPAIGLTLTVSATADEIVVSLDEARLRFLDSAKAVAHIRLLVGESIVVESWYSGPHLRGTAFAVANEPARAPQSLRGVTRIKRKSWRGTHDADLKVE